MPRPARTPLPIVCAALAAAALSSCTPGPEPKGAGAASGAAANATTPTDAGAEEADEAGREPGAQDGIDAPAGDAGSAKRPSKGERSCKLGRPDATCCDRDFGLDARAVMDACGFEAYRGEVRGPTSCEHHFEVGQPQPAVLTVAEFDGLSFDAAVALHMAGFFGAVRGDEVEGAGRDGALHLSGLGKLAWAHVDGWSAPRRVAWSKAECAEAKLRPVLEAMAAASESQPAPRPFAAAPAQALPLPAGTDEGAGPKGSLLARYADRKLEPPGAAFELPAHAMRMIIMVLIRAGKDSVADFGALFTPDARWGIPDRHELRAHPILRDGGWSFLGALREAASRFGHDAKFTCPPLSTKGSAAVARGEMPMWCTYSSDDGLDLLVFKLVATDAGARVDYVGLFPKRPLRPLRAIGEPPPPPLRPIDRTRAEGRAEAVDRARQGAAAPRGGSTPRKPPRKP